MNDHLTPAHMALRAVLVALLVGSALGSDLQFALGSQYISGQIQPGDQPYIVGDHVYYPLPRAEGYVEEGVASWYGADFHGQPTSSGELYDMNAMTAAHRTLPMNTMLVVRNLENGRTAVVRINDRGPFARSRILDLSRAAALRLGLYTRGSARIRLTVLGEQGQGNAFHGQRQRAVVRHPDLYRGKFYVQVGAFVNEGNAQRLARGLRRFWEQVEVFRVTAPDGRTFHRVQVYVGDNLGIARRREASLVRAGFSGAFVVAR